MSSNSSCTRLAAFSSCQNYFASITKDNRLKIWDVTSNSLRQELKERDHLSYKYTCLAWTSVSPFTPAIAKGKRDQNASLGLIALGTSSGDIVLWNLQTGELEQRLSRSEGEAGHSGYVNDIAFNAQGNKLYSCANEKYILEWDVQNGSVSQKLRCGSEGTRKLAIAPGDESLAAASNSIKIFDLVSGKKNNKYSSGHSSAVSQLFYSSCKKFLISASGERFVNVLNCTSERDEPLLNFSSDASPTGIFAQVQSKTKKSKDNIVLGTVSENGFLSLFQHAIVKDPITKPINSTIKVSSKSESKSPLIFMAEMEHVNNSRTVILARGSAHLLQFEKLAILNQESMLISELVVEDFNEGVLNSSNATKKAKNSNTIELNSANANTSTAKQGKDVHVPNLVDRGSVKISSVIDNVANEGSSESNEVNESDNDEVSLAERIENLRGKVDSNFDALVKQDDDNVEDKKMDEKINKKVQASSLVTVLEQALHSKDNSLLEYCLRIRDSKIVDETVKRLSSTRVLLFLTLVVEKFEKRPNRGQALSIWIRSILINHTAYLITVPNLVQNLSTLYQSLETRLKVFPHLHKLSGRLNLVLGQIAERAQTLESTDVNPHVVYNDEDNSESEQEEDEQEAEEGSDSENDDGVDEDGDETNEDED